MKTLTITFLALACSINTFARCNSTLDIQLFSSRFTDASQVKGYAKIIKEIKRSGLETIDGDAAYSTVIEAGVENSISSGKDTLLSHITVTNRNGKVVFEDYKNKMVPHDKYINSEMILQFVAKHIKKKYPTCGI